MTASTNYVTVACKIPAGIFMQGYQMVDSQETMPGGYRKVKVAQPVGERIKINGPAAAQGMIAPGLVDGGYVLTHNVPADVAAAWFDANKDSLMIKNKLVFISEKAVDAAAEAKDYSEIKSGLERLDVSTRSERGREIPNDPRWPRSNNPNVSGISTDDKK